ncbi:anillin-like [Diorhabda sublineata]|uniref:anillin-like n=1 Tax=Diorhabda sublineata TaxID=1163346 RepID=UPI0024E16136|nr:anillin-like [Diorhabda sublineata]
MEKENFFSRKPINLLLEIIFNKKNKKVESVRTANISNSVSLNDLTHSFHCVNKSQASSTPDTRSESEKLVQIKIKLDISDIDKSNHNDSEKLLEPVNSTESISELETDKETKVKKMSSKVSLSINNDTNFEETVYFDVYKTGSEESLESVTELYNEIDLNESHLQSIIWQKIFYQIQQKYKATNKDNKIVNVIHELIMEKYKQALSIIKQRIEKREQKSSSLHSIISNDSNNADRAMKNTFSILSIKSQFDLKTNEIIINDIFHTTNSSDPKYFNSTFKSEVRLSKSLDDIDKFSTNSAVEKETPFVQQSKELEICHSGTEYSIGSSNISLLISEADYAKSKRNYNSYRKLNRFKNSAKQSEQQSITSSSTHIYESLDDLLLNNNRNNLVKKIDLQKEIIQQSAKAAKVCRSQSELFGEETLIEAEKILLIAGKRKNAIEEALMRADYEDVDTPLTSCTVKIHNICLYASSSLVNSNSNWFYVCTLQQGSTVYATKITTQTENTISFPDEFIFENIHSDFQIDINVYALLLKKRKNKNFVYKSREEAKVASSCRHASTESYFSLWGTSSIKTSQANQTIFRLSNIPSEASIINSFTANIRTSYKIHVKQAGFLTLGLEYKGYPVWRRRWCLLNGYKLRYWFLPNEQDICPPLGEINLLNCVSNEIKRADKDLCFNSTTLVLQMNVNDDGRKGQRKYFLSADNYVEFDKWLREFNIVLYYLRKWTQYSNYSRQ